MINQKKLKSFRSFLVCLSIGIVTPLIIPSKAFSMIFRLPIEEFSGNFSSVSFIFEGQSVETGIITTSLDPTRASTFIFNDQTGEASIDLSLLLDFPLLDTINEPSPRIHILEEGTGAIDPNGVLIADLFGGGTIESPSIFEGVEFTNRNRYYIKLIPPEVGFECTFLFTKNLGVPTVQRGQSTGGCYQVSDGTVEFPPSLGGGSQPITGEGTLSVNVHVPEPTSNLSLLTLGILGAASTKGRKLKQSKSTEKETTKVS